jgi:membrane protein implicated in regulation of membrane protease activity
MKHRPRRRSTFWEPFTMTWRLFWFILFMAGVAGNVYYYLIATDWPLRVAMGVLSCFAAIVLQLEWYTSKRNRTQERLKAQEEASLRRAFEREQSISRSRKQWH